MIRDVELFHSLKVVFIGHWTYDSLLTTTGALRLEYNNEVCLRNRDWYLMPAFTFVFFLPRQKSLRPVTSSPVNHTNSGHEVIKYGEGRFSMVSKFFSPIFFG